jgi:hypothetical protein
MNRNSECIPRSLVVTVYTPHGGTKKSALKGCLPAAGSFSILERIIALARPIAVLMRSCMFVDDKNVD